MSIFQDKTLMITGGTGSFGTAVLKRFLAPDIKVFAPWRDPELLKQFPGRTQMVDYLAKFGIIAFAGGKKKYSTDCNLAGLSHEAEDLESMQTPMTIVEPTMGVWPFQAPDKPERFTARFEKGRCVAITRWMPAARPICATRQMDSSTSFAATSIRSASSSMTTTICGIFSYSGEPAESLL